MPEVLKWLCRIGIIGIVVIWFYLLLIFLFSEGIYQENSSKVENRRDIVNLKAITIGTPPSSGVDKLYEELDQLTIPELGCTLRFDFIPWGDERKQINIATASGEYDFIPGGSFSDYRTQVTKNAFLDMNQYLSLVSDLVKHYNSKRVDTLSQCEINGALYGLPQYSNIGIKNIGSGFFYREDLRKKWGLSPITDIDTIEAYLYRAKQDEKYKNEPLITDNRIWMALWDLLSEGKYIEITSAMEMPFVVVAADNPYIPINRIETPEFKLVLSYIQKWYDDGIIASDMLVASDNEGTKGLNLMIADKKPCETNVPFWSCTNNYIPTLYQTNPSWEFGFFDYRLNSAKLYTGSLAKNSVISISSKTSNPEIAMKLLEKLHTDKRYYNLLYYGVEGINYEVKNDTITYESIANEDYFTGWTAASDEELNYKVQSVNTKWQKEVVDVYNTQALVKQKEAESDRIDAFSFDSTPVGNTLRSIETIKKEFMQPLVCGVTQDKELALIQLQNELISAGMNEYLAELEKRLQEYKNK